MLFEASDPSPSYSMLEIDRLLTTISCVSSPRCSAERQTFRALVDPGHLGHAIRMSLLGLCPSLHESEVCMFLCRDSQYNWSAVRDLQYTHDDVVCLELRKLCCQEKQSSLLSISTV
jgi:hypothetical protein